METINKTKNKLPGKVDELQRQLEEANEMIEAIRTGQVDALIVQGNNGLQLYTLKSADQAYRVFIEKMAEGAVTLNHEGIILYCNSAFAFMVNLPLSNVLGLPFSEFVASESEKKFKKFFSCFFSYLDSPRP